MPPHSETRAKYQPLRRLREIETEVEGFVFVQTGLTRQVTRTFGHESCPSRLPLSSTSAPDSGSVTALIGPNRRQVLFEAATYGR